MSKSIYNGFSQTVLAIDLLFLQKGFLYNRGKYEGGKSHNIESHHHCKFTIQN